MRVVFQIQDEPRLCDLQRKWSARPTNPGAASERELWIVHREEYDSSECVGWLDADGRPDGVLFVTGEPQALNEQLRSMLDERWHDFPDHWHIFRCPVDEAPPPRVAARLEQFLTRAEMLRTAGELVWGELYDNPERDKLLSALLWCGAHCNGAPPKSLRGVPQVDDAFNYAEQYFPNAALEVGLGGVARTIRPQYARAGDRETCCKLRGLLEKLIAWPLPDELEKIRAGLVHGFLDPAKSLSDLLMGFRLNIDLPGIAQEFSEAVDEGHVFLQKLEVWLSPESLLKQSSFFAAPQEWKRRLLSQIPSDYSPLLLQPLYAAFDRLARVTEEIAEVNSMEERERARANTESAARALRLALRDERFLLR